MAKKITQQEYNEYEKLLKKYQRMRRKIIRAHEQIAERSRNFSRLPQMVAPERQTKVSLSSFRLTGRRIFAMKMRQLKKFVSGGYQAFYKEFKAQYLGLYQQLLEESPEKNPFGRGKGFLYSEEQMKLASQDEAQFMRTYNEIVRMNPMVFAYLIKTGRIPEFKKLYAQFQGEVRTQENWLNAMEKAVKMARRFNPNDAKWLLTGEIPEHLSKANKERLSKLLADEE